MKIYITNIGYLCCSTTSYNTNIGVFYCNNAIEVTNNGLIICSTATHYTNIGVMCCSLILLDSGIRSETNRTVGHTHATAMPCNRLYAKASCFRMMKNGAVIRPWPPSIAAAPALLQCPAAGLPRGEACGHVVFADVLSEYLAGAAIATAGAACGQQCHHGQCRKGHAQIKGTEMRAGADHGQQQKCQPAA